MQDVKEIEEIIENLKWLAGKMPGALDNWQKTKPNCLYHTSWVKEICEKPGKIKDIFDPLIKWLFDYILSREGKIAFAGSAGLDAFLKKGLVLISNFIIVADFFSKNTQYFYPSPDPTKQKEYFESKKNQNLQTEIIQNMMSRLIGCNEKFSFLFLRLSKTINKLPDDLKRLQDYLERECISLKVSNLK